MADIRVENHGSIWLLRPVSERGTLWLDEHTDPAATWFGGALAVEPRYVADILEGARNDGLEIR